MKIQSKSGISNLTLTDNREVQIKVYFYKTNNELVYDILHLNFIPYLI